MGEYNKLDMISVPEKKKKNRKMTPGSCQVSAKKILQKVPEVAALHKEAKKTILSHNNCLEV